jgi:hypothetical protein
MSVGQASGRPTATSFYLFLLGRRPIASEKLNSDEESFSGAKDIRHPFARPRRHKALARHAWRSAGSPPWTRQ